MIKQTNVTKYDMVRLPDTFRPSVIDTNNKDNKDSKVIDGKATVEIYFGKGMDIVVIMAKNKKLSDDNKKRIDIIINEESR